MVSKVWKDPVWSKVIAVAILALLSFIGTWALDLLPPVTNGLVSAWNWVMTDVAIPMWLLLLLLVPTGLLVVAVSSALLEKVRSNPENMPEWKKYTSDHFFGARYEWQWSRYNEPEHFVPFCTMCDAMMTQFVSPSFMSPTVQLICESCGHKGVEVEGSRGDLKRKVIINIDRNARLLAKEQQ